MGKFCKINHDFGQNYQGTRQKLKKWLYQLEYKENNRSSILIFCQNGNRV